MTQIEQLRQAKLREIALAIDPIVLIGKEGNAGVTWNDDGSVTVDSAARLHPVRLSMCIEDDGSWEIAETYPEVQRFLARLSSLLADLEALHKADAALSQTEDKT